MNEECICSGDVCGKCWNDIRIIGFRNAIGALKTFCEYTYCGTKEQLKYTQDMTCSYCSAAEDLEEYLAQERKDEDEKLLP